MILARLPAVASIAGAPGITGCKVFGSVAARDVYWSALRFHPGVRDALKRDVSAASPGSSLTRLMLGMRRAMGSWGSCLPIDNRERTVHLYWLSVAEQISPRIPAAERDGVASSRLLSRPLFRRSFVRRDLFAVLSGMLQTGSRVPLQGDDAQGLPAV
jgi:hypothetical protein